jgi:predicted dehydrogenase
MSTANTATSAEGQNRPLNVALLGAGIFASTSHAPILKNNPDTFNCVAVWSRRIESASTLVSTTLQQSKAYSDLDEVLNLPNLDAVIMALPIDVQPEYVVKCLKANKHVLSEKPIAATVEEANKVLQVYTKDYSHLKWSVAENFRYEPAVLRAADIIQNKKDVSIGEPFLVSLTIRAPFLPTNKYLNTAWRKEPSWYGGLFIDAFVHASAMLRVMFGDAKSVSAITSSKSDYIPGVDTMSANVSWDNDLHGDISVTYFCKQMKFELEVMGSEGSMIFARKTDGPGYHLKVLKNDGECIEEDFGFGGLEGEFFAFAAACKNEGSDQNTPSEARKDLAFVEACLLSGKSNGEKTNVEV